MAPNKGRIVTQQITISPVSTKSDRDAFIDFAYHINATDPNWVPQLRSDEVEKYTPGGNPFHEHARCQYFLAARGGRIVGRISAHIDELALSAPAEQGMGPGTGNWGAFEAEDEAVGQALIAAAEGWLRGQGMTRVLAPISLSIWEEPGLLVKGHDHPPTVMMGHNSPRYQGWFEALGYARIKLLSTYELDITVPFPPLIQRIIASGEKNPRINVRKIDMKRYTEEAHLVLEILNDAWSDNWGFVPITDSEIAFTAKKLKPLVRDDLIMVAELDGEPVAFMMTLPDANKELKRFNRKNGKPSLLGWLRLGLWLWKPRNADMRVPLMGVRKRLQASRIASQLAFMMIEYIRNAAVKHYGGKRGEIGWVLDDNQGMNAIADAIGSTVNREYAIYEKAL
jgi:GNAT superfamily N-acetyltransferase